MSPLQRVIGSTIQVEALAVDPESDPVSYLWSSPGGEFADPSAPTATFTCLEP